MALFLLLFGSWFASLFTTSAAEANIPIVENLNNEIVIELEEMVIAELIEQTNKAEEPEVEREKKFLKTSGAQLAGAPDRDTAAIGERDTLAASNGEVDTNAARVASQQGEEQRSLGDIRTVQGSFSDGKIGSLFAESDAGGTSAASVLSSKPLEENVPLPLPENPVPFDEAEQSEHQPERSPDVQTPLPSQNPFLSKHQESEKKMDVNPFRTEEVTDNKPKQATPAPIAESGQELLDTKPKELLPSAKHGVAKSESKDSKSARMKGFKSGGRTTKLLGSISRTAAVSSQDVASSLLGRYQAAVSQAVEREWMANCTKYREFINPGVITVRFYIDEDGGVHKVKIMEMIEGSEIQKSFTYQSVIKAPIPSMPAQLKYDQNGEPLELIYNFIF